MQRKHLNKTLIYLQQAISKQKTINNWKWLNFALSVQILPVVKEFVDSVFILHSTKHEDISEFICERNSIHKRLKFYYYKYVSFTVY